MYPLSGQIQRASDASKFAAQRLSRIEAPKFPDDETTLAQLRQRVADTIAYLQGLAPQASTAPKAARSRCRSATSSPSSRATPIC